MRSRTYWNRSKRSQKTKEGDPIMLIPVLSKPVIRPQVFTIALLLIDDEWEPIVGANANPNDPEYFRQPVSCDRWCSLFGGGSFAACLAACRR
jgi:hypothetical protein